MSNVWYGGTYSDTSEGRPNECRYCGRVRPSNRIDAERICDTCRICKNCGVNKWTVDDGKMRCALCRCFDCGSTGITGLMFAHDGLVSNICSKCYVKRFPGALCSKCLTKKPTIRLRGHAKPRLCRFCAFERGQRHHCWHCGASDAKNHDPQGRITCHACTNRPACFDEKCEPRRQCKRHREAQKEIDAEAARIEAEAIAHQTRVAPRQQRLDVATPLGNPFTHRLSRATGRHITRADRCEACMWERDHPREVLALARARLLGAEPEQTIFLPRAEGRVIFHKAGISEFKRNKSHRFLGVEIEVCGLREPRQTLLVRDTVQRLGGAIVHDGSLPGGGFEITTAAAQGDLYPKHIAEIVDALTKGQAYVDGAAGLHVHVDCRDFTYDDMRRLLILYSRIEPALIAMQPWDRVFIGSPGNGRMYCAPCGYKYAKGVVHLKQPKERYKRDRKSRLLSNIYGQLPARARVVTDDETGRRDLRQDGGVAIPRTEHYNPARYNALNVHSWFYRGTVECRLHEGSVSAEEIIPWGMLWAQIVDFAFKTPERQIITGLVALPDPVMKRDVYDNRVPRYTPEMRETAMANLMSLAPVAEVAAYITRRVEKYASDHKEHD